MAEQEKRITLRLPDDVHKDVAARARDQQRSVNAQVVYELRKNKERASSESAAA